MNEVIKIKGIEISIAKLGAIITMIYKGFYEFDCYYDRESKDIKWVGIDKIPGHLQPDVNFRLPLMAETITRLVDEAYEKELSEKDNNAVDRFDQANSAQIGKMFWIAGSLEYGDIEEFLDDMGDNGWKDCFPELRESEAFTNYQEDNELTQMLIDNDKFGIIAEVTYPTAYDFSYDGEDNVTGASLSMGRRHIRYAYGETLEELLTIIEKYGEEEYESDKKQDKAKKEKDKA